MSGWLGRGPRTTRVKGFTRRGIGRGATTPRLPRAELPGLTGVPRAKTPTHTYVWPPPPQTWLASIGEWITFWYLMYIKRWEFNRTWYYNGRVFLPFYFASRDWTQADFIVDLGPGSQAGMLAPYRAIVLDPITPFTHPDPQRDRDRRTALDEEGYLLIFLEEWALMFQTRRVLEDALRGRDVSTRGVAA